MTSFTPFDLTTFSALLHKLEIESEAKRNEILSGIGEHASIYEPKEKELSLLTTAMLLEGIHFDLTYTPFHYLGFKIVSVVVSDLCAMNAEPVQIQVSVGLPNRISAEMAEMFFTGISDACNYYSIQLTKADATASHQLLAISVSAAGRLLESERIKKSGATRDDLLCVTGDLGASVAGLRILMREKKQWQEEMENDFQPDLEGYDYPLRRQLKPQARTDFRKAVVNAKLLPTSLTQIKNGLITDLKNLLSASHYSAEIYSPAIPIALETRKVAEEMNEDVDKYAFYGGEDFELLFTIPEKKEPLLRKVFDDFVVIGKITPPDGNLKINTGEETILIEI